SNRRARPWQISDDPLLLLPRLHEECEFFLVLLHLGNRRSLAKERPGGTRLHAFAARSACRRVAPRLIEIGDDPGVMPAARYVPRVRAFDFVADAHAAGTHHTTVMIDAELIVRNIDRQLRELILEAHVVHADCDREFLQFAMPVGDAD